MNPPASIKRPGIPAAFWYCLFSAGALCTVRFAAWKLSDAMLEFLLLPFLLLALALMAVGGVWSLVHLARRFRSDGWISGSPLAALALGGAAAFVAIPGSEMSEVESFHRYRREREAVVRLAQAEELEKVPNSPRFRKLPWQHRHVSDGAEILVDQPTTNPGVVFYTFRGLLTGGTRGIIYAADDNPQRLPIGPMRELEKLADRWYWFVTED